MQVHRSATIASPIVVGACLFTWCQSRKCTRPDVLKFCFIQLFSCLFASTNQQSYCGRRRYGSLSHLPRQRYALHQLQQYSFGGCVCWGVPSHVHTRFDISTTIESKQKVDSFLSHSFLYQTSAESFTIIPSAVQYAQYLANHARPWASPEYSGPLQCAS